MQSWRPVCHASSMSVPVGVAVAKRSGPGGAGAGAGRESPSDRKVGNKVTWRTITGWTGDSRCCHGRRGWLPGGPGRRTGG